MNSIPTSLFLFYINQKLQSIKTYGAKSLYVKEFYINQKLQSIKTIYVLMFQHYRFTSTKNYRVSKHVSRSSSIGLSFTSTKNYRVSKLAVFGTLAEIVLHQPKITEYQNLKTEL